MSGGKSRRSLIAINYMSWIFFFNANKAIVTKYDILSPILFTSFHHCDTMGLTSLKGINYFYECRKYYSNNKKGSSYYISGMTPKPIKIPSQMYPLRGNVIVLNDTNTEPFPDGPQTDKIKEIYNSITPGVGTCYTNTEKLINALTVADIQATPFVGWIFLNGALPVHHCFAAIGNHLLDFNPNLELLYQETYAKLPVERLRDEITNRLLKLRELPNSEYTSFGRASAHTLYFASPCKPQDGLNVYKKLMRAFPKHPCYRNIIDGTNETQKLMLQKQGLL